MGRKLLVAVVALLPLFVRAETILVLGDSISAAYGMSLEAGWVNLLQQRLNERYPGDYNVVNASISGDTTAGGLKRLPPLLEQYQPDVVLVELGGNDGLRGMSLPRMQENLQAIIDQSREQGAAVVLLSIELPQSYGVFFNRRFSQVFTQLVEDNEVPRVELGYKLLDRPELLQSDGIHPTAEAQPLLLEAVWPALETLTHES